MPKSNICGALVVASGRSNTYIKFHSIFFKWLSYKLKTICPYLDIRTTFDSNRPINLSNINLIGKVNLNYMFSVIYRLILVKM